MRSTPDPHVRRTTESGFTLVEVLVVLTIAVLAFALIPGTVRIGQRVMTVAADVEQSAAARRAMTVLERRIAAARPIYTSAEDGLARLMFSGTPERLRFVTTLADGPQTGGLYLADVHLKNGTDTADTWLTMTLTPYPAGEGVAVAGQSIALLRARNLSLRYLGVDAQRDALAWRTDWTDHARLPEAVEMTVPGMAPRLVRLHLNVAGQLRP